MHAIQLSEPGSFKPIDIADPGEPGAGQALLATRQMGICGTDVGGYLGKMPFFSYPRIIGHELGVEVLAVGDGVTNVKPGDRCCVRPYIVCGECYSCRRGAVNCCAKSQTFGVMCDGGLCERFVLDAGLLHASETLNYEQLALVETLAIGCHAVDRAEPREGEHMLIVGIGPIGLSALEFAKLSGTTITVLDLSEGRLEFVRNTYGVEHTLTPGDDVVEKMAEITNGEMYPFVADASGHAGSMAACPSYLSQTGTLVYVGINQGEVLLHHPTFHRPEGTLKASRNALPKDFDRIIKLIEDGKIDTNPWITHRVGFDTMPGEFERLTKPETGVIKAMVEVAA